MLTCRGGKLRAPGLESYSLPWKHDEEVTLRLPRASETTRGPPVLSQWGCSTGEDSACAGEARSPHCRDPSSGRERSDRSRRGHPRRVLATPPPVSPPPARSLSPRPGRTLASPRRHAPRCALPARCEAPSAPRQPPAPAGAAAAHSLWPPPALPPSWPLASPAPGGPSRRVT